MRLLRLLSPLLLGIALAGLNAATASAALETRAEHGLLMDGESGQVLWAKTHHLSPCNSRCSRPDKGEDLVGE